MSLNENQPAEECLCKTGNFWVRCPIHDASRAGVEEQSLGKPEAFTDDVKAVLQKKLQDWLKPQCSRLLYGQCHTYNCLKRGGYRTDATQAEREAAYGNATCEPYEISVLLGGRSLATGASSLKSPTAPSVVEGVEEKRWHYEAFDGHHVCAPHPEHAMASQVLFTCATHEDALKAISAHNASLGEPRGELPAAHVLQKIRELLPLWEARGKSIREHCAEPNYRDGLIDATSDCREDLKKLLSSVSESSVGSTATVVSDEEEIAREASHDIRFMHRRSYSPDTTVDAIYTQIILTAIRKAKSLSEPPNFYPSVCTTCWYVQRDEKLCVRCSRDSLQPVICDALFQPVSEPKELEEEKHD